MTQVLRPGLPLRHRLAQLVAEHRQRFAEAVRRVLRQTHRPEGSLDHRHDRLSIAVGLAGEPEGHEAVSLHPHLQFREEGVSGAIEPLLPQVLDPVLEGGPVHRVHREEPRLDGLGVFRADFPPVLEYPALLKEHVLEPERGGSAIPGAASA